jgi:hypothetical protein
VDCAKVEEWAVLGGLEKSTSSLLESGGYFKDSSALDFTCGAEFLRQNPERS